jgi:hypothetical protein
MPGSRRDNTTTQQGVAFFISTFDGKKFEKLWAGYGKSLPIICHTKVWRECTVRILREFQIAGTPQHLGTKMACFK